MRPVLVVLALAACGSPQRTGGGGGGGQSGGNSAPIPADVRKTIDTTLGPDARVSSEHEGGATIYEAAAQTRLEVELSDAGKLLKAEVAVPVATLPEAVINALAGKGKIKEAEVVVLPTGVAFEVEVGEAEYTVDASGKILGEEHEDGEEDDKD